MQGTRLHLDFEVFSHPRADVTVVGSSRHARDPETEPLMLSYAFGDEQEKLWVPAETIEPRAKFKSDKAWLELMTKDMPYELKETLLDPDYIKIAWNKPYEWNIFKHCLNIEIPHNQWRDSMVLAYSLSLPGALDAAGKVVQLPDDLQKDARGKALIRKFCSYRKPSKLKPWNRDSHITAPIDWADFKKYCCTDTRSERAMWRRMVKYNMPEEEWDLWFLDQEINERGIPVNMNVVRRAQELYAYVIDDRMEKLRDITGLANPNSNQQLLPWLKKNGYIYSDLVKGHVKKAKEEAEQRQTEDPLNAFELDDYIAVLGYRQEISKASVKKYKALEVSTDSDSFLRYTLQFAGAGRTWRWAGRKYQAQNLAKPVWYLEEHQVTAVRHLERLDNEALLMLYDYPMDLLSTCVRPVLQAPEGFTLIDADLNAIENRGIGWLAGDAKILKVFADGRCPYIDFATRMYGQSYEELWHEYKVEKKKKKRTNAKPPVLGGGYGLGPGHQWENEETGEMEADGLLGYAWNMGVMLTPEESALAVQVFRDTYTDVVEYWWELDRASKRCVRTGKPQQARKLTFDLKGPFLRMGLPSGRYLHYVRPTLQMRETPWGQMKETLCYEGLNDKNQWVTLQTRGAKLLENGTQAWARDLLAHGMKLAAKAGIDIRLHVHDQIVGLVALDRAKEALEILLECMKVRPWWGEDIPLGAEGIISPCFIKD